MKSLTTMASAHLPATASEPASGDPCADDDEILGWWRASASEPPFSAELDHDARLGRRAETLSEPSDEDEAGGEFSGRFASGTGQFDLRAPELGAARAEASICEIMLRRVLCARPEMEVAAARARMLERGVGGMPVVDHWGRVIGMLSSGDLVEHGVTGEPCGRRVSEVMMPLAFSLPADATIGQAAALMAYEGISRVVVVDRTGHLLGLVTALDVARWLGRACGYPVGRRE